MTSAFDNLMAGIAPVPAAPVNDEGLPIDIVPLALDLYDFQVEAVKHALRDTQRHPYGYIGLEMGLGKTPCGIALAAAMVNAGIRPVLVVCPPSMRVTWAREIARFAPWLKSATVRSTKPEVNEVIPSSVDVLIIGDSSVAGWATFLAGKVGGLVVDEAHRFKNKSSRSAALVTIATGVVKDKDPVTQRTVKVQLCDPSQTPRMRFLMSGTPTPNGRHAELATQVDVLGDKAWKDIGGKGMFWHRYAPQVDQWGGRGTCYGEELNEAMTGSWFYRRLRADVIDLPGKGRTALHLEGQGKAVKDYLEAERDLIEWLKAKNDGMVTDGQRRAAALIKMLALRKLAGEAKVKSVVAHVKELLDEVPGGVFVVAEHSDVIDNLLIGLSKYNPTTVRGGMSDEDKADNVDAFTSGESRVLVGQITAAGVGLTLHGGGINHHVVVAQLPWTPAELKQAEDRLDRIGQTNKVQVEVALAAIEGSWTIDERLWGMLETKNFNSTTITDGAGEYLLSEIQDGLLDSYR